MKCAAKHGCTKRKLQMLGESYVSFIYQRDPPKNGSLLNEG